MAVFIFEGPDNVGKGTQIQNLKKYLESKNRLVHVLHYSNIKGTDIERRSKRYYEQMFHLCQESIREGFDFILDRAHIGETVYSPIYRNYSGDYVFDLEKQLELKSYRLFVFIDKPENLIKRDDGQSFSIEVDKKRDEINRFKLAFDKSNITHKMLIDINGIDAEGVWNRILNDITRGNKNAEPELFDIS